MKFLHQSFFDTCIYMELVFCNSFYVCDSFFTGVIFITAFKSP